MDDIVTRLREEALRPAIRVAADEIERLRYWCDRLATALGDSNPSHPAYEAWEEAHRG